MADTDCKIFMYNSQKSYIDYQNYYIDGIRLLGISFKENASNTDVSPLSFSDKHSKHVGQYIASFTNGKQVKLAIDTSDGKEISSKDICDWADIYFKSNYWETTIEYQEKIVPIVNGNGMVNISKLKELRQQEKTYDLAFISRIHGGREHNIRLFEKISKVKGNKRLTAILNEFDKKQPEYQRRLEAAGVTCRYKPLNRDDLWNVLSKARYVLIHAGKHLCISWRMIDLLCLGSSIISDAPPYPQWPQPLVNGIHYISLGIDRPLSGDEAEDKYYDAIQDNLTAILKNFELQTLLSQNAQSYFDEHADPKKVTQYILDCIMAQGLHNV